MDTIQPVKKIAWKRKGSVATTTGNEDNNVELAIEDEISDESLHGILSPLLTSMRLCGQYFKWPFGMAPSSSDNSRRTNIKINSALEVRSVVISIVLLVILWINGIRISTIFTSNETSFPINLSKVMVVSWNIQCALQQTAYFLACRKGKLDKVLRDIRLKSPRSNAFVRLFVVKVTVAAWLGVAINMIFFIYGIGFTDDLNYQFAPFGSYLPISNPSAVRIAFIILSIPLHPAFVLPIAMTFMLSVIFTLNFRGLVDRLRQAIKVRSEDNDISEADIEDIRQQHQFLCHSVKRADRFLRIYHLPAFFGPLAIVIIVLYTLLFKYWMTGNNPIFTLTLVFWMMASLLQLVLTAAGGLIVNHYVCIVVYVS